MKNIKNWTKGKSFIIAITAPQIALNVNACYELLLALKSGDRIEGNQSLPDHEEWLSLYRDHRRLESKLKEIFLQFGDNIEMAFTFRDIFIESRKQILKLGPKKYERKVKEAFATSSPDELIEIQNFLDSVFEASMNDIEDEIQNKRLYNLNIDIKKILTSPEVMFYLGVWAPCWLLYGEFPPVLMRKARTGDIESIEKLIRLDKTAIHDSKISEIFHQARGSANKSKFNTIIKALSKGPKNRITVQSIKCNFAGLISAIAIILGSQLNEPEIRSLFDAIAQDFGKGDIDIDLPESPEAFAKAIQRSRTFWINAVQNTDKINI